ncbi:hypothetical protein B0A49_06827 [Cryomyces minteri]|uniref:Peptidase M20 dimerisation domain-containing protein n=1 Tax=Cryomyces minteri TaxID=331657 RepID=A0A4U0WR25_9PEZI|nr:hypothetical protein B0A49_06827 [Cryomyces minteri]
MAGHKALRINGTRLNETLQSTCTQWGALSSSTGMRRLTLSQADKDVRDWLVKECKKLGCEVKVDQMGNIFATRPGKGEGLKPIAMGSHLDTQPAGGRYDGILGVQSALEVLRTLHENDVATQHPIMLIDWTNEEGARFPGAMMCSGVWSTKSSTPLEACYRVTDSDGIDMRTALDEIGYLGTTPCDYRENGLEAYFELHIEQGPKLEQEGKSVGIVTAVQGMKWFAVRVTGVEGHSGMSSSSSASPGITRWQSSSREPGTTPMPTRSDALITAALLISAVRTTALETSLGVATVGVITSDTQSQAMIPSGIDFIIDVRCPTDAQLAALCAAIFTAFDAIVASESNHTAYSVTRSWGLPESVFHPSCIAAVRAAAVAEVGELQCMEMKSGAGHDAAWTSKVVPSSMIFVPSKDGVSHNPAEYTSPEHCTLGAQVLLQAVLAYDGRTT